MRAGLAEEWARQDAAAAAAGEQLDLPTGYRLAIDRQRIGEVVDDGVAEEEAAEVESVAMEGRAA